MTAIKPTFQALAHPDLLRKCLHGQTQNVNESFNNVVWTRVPKNVFAGLDTLELGIRDAAVVFNDGNVGRLRILQEFGVADLGRHTITALQRFDKVRLRQAELAAEAMTKVNRIKKRRQLLGEEVEDDPQYIPGGF